jgi:integrase
MPRKRIRQIGAKQDALSDAEIEELKEACRDLKDRFVVWTPIYSGLRVGEVAHMNRSWLGWNEKVINIPPQQACWCWDCRHYRRSLWMPKTQSGVRSIRISSTLELILQQYFETVRQPRQVSRQAWEWRLAKIARRTGIQHRAYPHALQATCATLWATQGMSAPSLQYLMGWEQLESAEHYVQSTKRQALEGATRILG